MVATAPWAWLDTAEASSPATARSVKRIEVDFGLLFIWFPFIWVQLNRLCSEYNDPTEEKFHNNLKIFLAQLGVLFQAGCTAKRH